MNSFQIVVMIPACELCVNWLCKIVHSVTLSERECERLFVWVCECVCVKAD